MLHRLTATLYFFPRVALDGAAACRERRTAHTLGEELADFVALVQRVCLRLDCALFQRALAVPSLHQMMEMCALVSPAGPVGQVRHVTALELDGAHQPNKRAIAGGNGHDDAGQATRGMVESEFFSRMVLAPSSFFVPPEWMTHPGVREAFVGAHALWSLPSPAWSLTPALRLPGDVPAGARAVASLLLREGAATVWHHRAGRREGDVLCTGDAVCMLVSGSPGRTAVNVAQHGRGGDQRVVFFRIVCLFRGAGALPCAIVQPYVRRSSTTCVYDLDVTAFYFLKLQSTVQRALVLHDCFSACAAVGGGSGMSHDGAGGWIVLGRKRGRAFRSA